MGMSDQRSTPAALPSRNRPGTHFTGGHVGQNCWPRRLSKTSPHRVSIPGQAVNGILSNCKVYILFLAIGCHRVQCDTHTGSFLPVCKCICLYHPSRSRHVELLVRTGILRKSGSEKTRFLLFKILNKFKAKLSALNRCKI
jgi:hypothetical protein